MRLFKGGVVSFNISTEAQPSADRGIFHDFLFLIIAIEKINNEIGTSMVNISTSINNHILSYDGKAHEPKVL